jgi:hypothetical protein
MVYILVTMNISCNELSWHGEAQFDNFIFLMWCWSSKTLEHRIEILKYMLSEWLMVDT